jgi:hypothetical protein
MTHPSLNQLRPGQAPPAKGEPVIQRIDFIDMTKAAPKSGTAN